MFFFDYDDYTNLASTGLRSGTPEGFLGKSVLKICRKLQENIHAEVSFQ